MERKLNKNLDLKQKYNDVMNEYITLGHMSPIKHETVSKGFYLPHHALIKETSMTTKVRVVFDGSAKSSTGISLNDTLLIGPTIQSDLFSLLIRFRQHPIVLTGDIEKMYRQFLVKKEDRKFQRILWKNKNNSLQVYELNTVTFGLASAPYLAIRCLHQLAEDEGHEYVAAAKILQEDFYVDDVLTGAQTREDTIALRNDLTQLLSKAGLSIRQWASNDPTVLQSIPQENINLQLQLGDTATLKTLGIYWNANTDSINYSVSLITMNTITKRNILAETAKIFDPLGLLTPVIIIAKIILQKLWSLKVHWDESLPHDIHTEWDNYYKQLPILNNISFPRTIISQDLHDLQLHGFSDASERAYGACIFLRAVDSKGLIKVQLLCSKSRVAPLKTLTIPRLELCAAQLLSKLVTSTLSALKLNINSTIADIQERTKKDDWHHVRTHDNPADFVSRGMKPKDFINSTIWKQGPSWLSNSSQTWPITKLHMTDNIPEKRPTTCLITTMVSTTIFNRFSTMRRLIRTLSFCYRYINTLKNKSVQSNDKTKQEMLKDVRLAIKTKTITTKLSPLTVKELKLTQTQIIKMIQLQAFSKEIKVQETVIQTDNKQLIKLNPFIDQEGLIRVGGRLSHSSLPYNSKHPIVLPKNHHVTRLLIEDAHRVHLHTGVQQTLYALRQNYWPLDGRSQVWKVLKKCIQCSKAHPPTTKYLMGDLPTPRVTQSRPFSQVGIDYCGPFFLKEKKFRNKSKIKSYVAVFVCLAVKAVHLELVTDLTTEGFISALRRFISRRGHCQDIYSDNGRNFVGANNLLNEINQMLDQHDNSEKIQGYLSTKNIQWHFIPPQAPHVGGLWEAAVKSFKRHLLHVAGHDMLFTYEQFNTLTIEIEAILNSRPLTPISSDPNDLSVLTPGHFLIGDSLTNLRGRIENDLPVNHLSAWQHVQRVKQHFWTRWSREYLNELTTRTKWDKSIPNITVGTIVLMRDDNLPPAQWTMGRIIACYPGEDGVVRTVQVKTPTTTLIRNIKKLSILPIFNDNHYSQINQVS